MTGIWNVFHRAGVGLAGMVIFASAACSVTAELNPSGTGGAAGGTTGGAGGGSVTVTFRNLTASEAVDVEFHTTEEPLAIVPADLFDPDKGFLLVRDIGVGGSGLLAPGTSDTITVDCTETAGLLLGTSGGTFVDNESGDERGRGDERWVQEGAQFSCGATIVFEFTGGGDAFSTGLLIGDGNDNDSGR